MPNKSDERFLRLAARAYGDFYASLSEQERQVWDIFMTMRSSDSQNQAAADLGISGQNWHRALRHAIKKWCAAIEEIEDRRGLGAAGSFPLSLVPGERSGKAKIFQVAAGIALFFGLAATAWYALPVADPRPARDHLPAAGKMIPEAAKDHFPEAGEMVLVAASLPPAPEIQPLAPLAAPGVEAPEVLGGRVTRPLVPDLLVVEGVPVEWSQLFFSDAPDLLQREYQQAFIGGRWVKHGRCYEFSREGGLARESNYRYGLQHGTTVCFTRAGTIAWIREFDSGRLKDD